MTFKKLSLSQVLKNKKYFQFPDKEVAESDLEKLQLQMLRVQQGNWHTKGRVVIVFEGFDAAGKGGAIRKLTEKLDPRGVQVHPIGPPTPEELGQHWLQRFWSKLPAPGMIAIFDRSWYGRVLVERVDKLADKKDWQRAYSEINEFERMLVNDGITVIKIFMAISKKEQEERFQDRMKDPYKQWKITPSDIKARQQWNAYVKAVDEMLAKTNTRVASWSLIPADSKEFARNQVLTIVIARLKFCKDWIQKQVKSQKQGTRKRS